jgi:hypothetical protein
MASILETETKPIFQWKRWFIGNGVFTLLVVFGLSYQNVFSLILAFCFILLHIFMYLTVFLALQDRVSTADKVIRVFVNAQTHPPAFIDTLYDGALICYLIAVKAYIFALLYFVVMLLQRIAMHKAENYIKERPFR